jgi:hypothetical protein
MIYLNPGYPIQPYQPSNKYLTYPQNKYPLCQHYDSDCSEKHNLADPMDLWKGLIMMAAAILLILADFPVPELSRSVKTAEPIVSRKLKLP